MTALDLDALLSTAERAARAGGAIVRADFGRARDVREKAPGDWVSQADLASEAAVRDLLTRESTAPGLRRGGGRGSLRHRLARRPARRHRELRARLRRGRRLGRAHRGRRARRRRRVRALARALLRGRARGHGAFRDGRRIHVSTRSPAQSIVATGFPFRRKELLPRYEQALGRALRDFEDLRRVGAATLDLCWTAEGVFDGFFELRLGPWDVAAGGIIVREAGGIVTDWNGDDGAWLRSGDILAGSPAVHAALLQVVARSAGDIDR